MTYLIFTQGKLPSPPLANFWIGKIDPGRTSCGRGRKNSKKNKISHKFILGEIQQLKQGKWWRVKKASAAINSSCEKSSFWETWSISKKTDKSCCCYSNPYYITETQLFHATKITDRCTREHALAWNLNSGISKGTKRELLFSKKNTNCGTWPTPVIVLSAIFVLHVITQLRCFLRDTKERPAFVSSNDSLILGVDQKKSPISARGKRAGKIRAHARDSFRCYPLVTCPPACASTFPALLPLAGIRDHTQPTV